MDNIELSLSVLEGKSDKEIVELLQEKLLKKCGVCPRCHMQRRLVASKNHKGGYAARCSRCKQFVNLTEGTFFEKTRLSFKQIIDVKWPSTKPKLDSYQIRS